MASPRKLKRKSSAVNSGGRSGAARIIGAGEMAELIRGFDWSASDLGPIAGWSDTLVTTVNMLLASRHPMFLWWGPELIQFYNDGYRPSIREDKHPLAVGQRGVDCWPEIWPIIGPQIDGVMGRGESTWNLNQLVPINRNGKLEEVYWTYSYSPVRDEAGAVQGTLVVCSETTEPVLSERRLRTLLAIALEAPAQERLPGPESLDSFARSIVRTLDDDPADIPFAGIYLVAEEKIAHAAGTASAGGLLDPGHWPVVSVVESQVPVVVENLQGRLGNIVCPPWPELVNTAYVLPLNLPASSVQAVMVFGVSPRLPFDGNYRTFFQLVGTRIAGLLQSEVHQMELAQAAKRFSSLVAANPFGLVIGKIGGELDYVNPAFLERLGYSQGELIAGRVRWDRLTPPEFAEADGRALEQICSTGEVRRLRESLFSEGWRAGAHLNRSCVDQPTGKRSGGCGIRDRSDLSKESAGGLADSE
jgi:PAS domain S-box-containing protein